jgi:hypothetical protein
MGDIRYEVRKAHLTTIDLVSQHWDEPIELLATDISPAGLFIPSDILLEAGEPVVACFKVPGHRQEFQLFGDVIWVALPRRATDTGTAGMGVRFVKTSPLERLTIRQSLRLLPPPLPFKGFGTHFSTVSSA